jgi:UDP-GlcNAc:undecaprenyl-phosphate/decaprenyl-phosphate GlcNAc-1-phosphate transferase
MITCAVAFVIALTVSAVLTPIVAMTAHRYRWLDQPSEDRRVHVTPVPRLGGIAVVSGFFTPLVALACLDTNGVSVLLFEDLRLFAGVLVGSIAIVTLGVYDDLKGADAKLKLLIQSLVAVSLWFIGFRIEVLGNPFGEFIHVGALSLPLTWLWVVGVINAMNLIDGLDGLASGIAIFASCVLFCAAQSDGAIVLCLLMAALAGALFGFLIFNFNPAKIFLGDSGSMFLGFLLASVSMWSQRKGTTAAALFLPVLALGLPILDTTLSFARRLIRGAHPFRADREHVHHRLMEAGLTHRGTVLTLYMTSAVFAMGALAFLDDDPIVHLIATSAVGVVVGILIHRIGFLSSPTSRRSARLREERQQVRSLSRRIRGATDDEQAWNLTLEVLDVLGAGGAELQWDGEHRRRRYRRSDETSPGAQTRDVCIEDVDGVYGIMAITAPEKVMTSGSFEGSLELVVDALAHYRTGQSSEPAGLDNIVALNSCPEPNRFSAS